MCEGQKRGEKGEEPELVGCGKKESMSEKLCLHGECEGEQIKDPKGQSPLAGVWGSGPNLEEKAFDLGGIGVV